MLATEAIPTTPEGEELSQDEWEEVRSHARRSLYFMAKGILGYTKLTQRAHRALCEFVEQDEPLLKEELMPRDHFKTTVVTISDSIRRVAINSNIRILIGNETSENSELMLREIRRHFENNPVFQNFFPELIPKNFNKTTWSDKEIVVPRSARHKESTITATGVGSTIASRHFDHLKLDDLIGEKAIKSPTVMKEAIRWLDYSFGLLQDSYTSRIDLTGTHWGVQDVYTHAEQNLGFVVFKRKPIIMGKDGPEPLLPSVISLERLITIMKNNPFQYATQYANDPYDAADNDFRAEWLRYYKVLPDGDLEYVDDFGSPRRVRFDTLECYAHVDISLGESATSHYSSVVVVGVTPDGLLFILEAWKRRVDPLGLIEKMFEVQDRYWPKKFTVEAVAYQKALIFFTEREARLRGMYLNIEPWYPGRGAGNKHARIRNTLQPYFNTGRFLIRENMFDFVDEFLSFNHTHPDILDALSQGPSVWKFPASENRMKKLQRILTSFENRGSTGYGM